MMKKIVYHTFTLAAAVMFQEVWKTNLFVYQPSVITPNQL